MIMENERKQCLMSVLLIIVSTVLCVLIYVLCLRQVSSLEPFSYYYREDYWAVYLIDLAETAGVGIFLAAALIVRSKIRQRICGIMTAVCAALYGVAFYGLGYGSHLIEQRFETLLVSLWPFITYGLALLLKKPCMGGKAKGIPERKIVRMGLYYLALLAVIAHMQEMIFSEFYKWEPLMLIYLMTVAALSWRLAPTKTEIVLHGGMDTKTETIHQSGADAKTGVAYQSGVDTKTEAVHQSETAADQLGTDKWFSTLAAGIPAVITIGLLLCNERVIYILRSLKNPITAIQGAREEVNWLGNRLALAAGAWHGDFSLLDEVLAVKIADGCPLLWADYVQGHVMAVLLLILSAVLLGSLLWVINWLQAGGKQPFLRLTTAALLLHSGIGLMAELFVFSTTDVGILLLRNPGDVILVIYVVMSAIEFGLLNPKGRDERKKLFRAVHGAYSAAKGSLFGGLGCIVLAAVFFHMREQHAFLFTVGSLELLVFGIFYVWLAFYAAMIQERKREEDKKAGEKNAKTTARTEENQKKIVTASIVPQQPVCVADEKLQRLAKLCGRGDVDAMYKLSGYLRGEKASNMWLLRAAMYGNGKAQRQVHAGWQICGL